MSSMFSKPSTPKIPRARKVEEMKVVKESAEDQKQRLRRHLISTSSYQQSFMAGIRNALKKRLGE